MTHLRARPTPLQIAVLLWLAAAAAAGVRTIIQPERHTIYPVLAGGSERWWADQRPYDDYRPLDYFRYPPAFAVFFTPFAALGPVAGGLLWVWMGLAVYGAGVVRFCRDVLPDDWSEQRRAAFYTLALLGALRGLWNAQSNDLAAGLLLLAASALTRRRYWSTALFMTAAVWIKVTPLAPALLLCALRPGRLGWRFAIVLLLGVALPFATRPPSIVLRHYAEYFEQMKSLAPERWPGFRDAWTLWVVGRFSATGAAGALSLRAPIDSQAYRVVQIAVAAACLGWCLALRWHEVPRRRVVCLSLSAGLVWLMLFGPAVEYPTYVLLAPVLAWGVLDPVIWPGGRPIAVAAAVLVHVLGWGAVGRALQPVSPWALTALPLGATLCLVWLVGCGKWLTRSAKRSEGFRSYHFDPDERDDSGTRHARRWNYEASNAPDDTGERVDAGAGTGVGAGT